MVAWWLSGGTTGSPNPWVQWEIIEDWRSSSPGSRAALCHHGAPRMRSGLRSATETTLGLGGNRQECRLSSATGWLCGSRRATPSPWHPVMSQAYGNTRITLGACLHCGFLTIPTKDSVPVGLGKSPGDYDAGGYLGHPLRSAAGKSPKAPHSDSSAISPSRSGGFLSNLT